MLDYDQSLFRFVRPVWREWKPREKKVAARNPGGEERVSRLQDVTRPFSPRGSFTIALDRLSEKGTTRSPGSLNISHSLFSRAC